MYGRMRLPSWWYRGPDSSPAPDSRAGTTPDSGNQPASVLCTEEVADVIRDYFGAAAAVDSDDYRPVPHDAEVTARIDKVMRECQVSAPENVTLSDPAPDYYESPCFPDESEHLDNYAFGASSDTVPLAEQIAQYGERCEEVLDALHTNLEDEWFRRAIIRLGVERLTEGYETFGSAMYGWDVNRRDDEMFCELADYVVYGSSGPFFDVGATHTNTPDVSEQP